MSCKTLKSSPICNYNVYHLEQGRKALEMRLLGHSWKQTMQEVCALYKAPCTAYLAKKSGLLVCLILDINPYILLNPRKTSNREELLAKVQTADLMLYPRSVICRRWRQFCASTDNLCAPVSADLVETVAPSGR
jgi:hypothetical protein